MSLRAIIVTIIWLGVLSFYRTAYPQIIDRATREADRPIREDVEKKLRVIPKKPPKIEEEEEKKIEGPTFFVTKILLVGCESFPADEFKPIIKEYENREVSIGEINILAKKIEREYLRRGVTAACFLPPQDVEDGVVTLRVVEAHMGALEIQDHSFFDKKRLANYWNIRPGEVLRYSKMSRSLQLMNKNPDRELTAALHAGTKPETTDVLLNVKTHFPVHLTADFDNEGATSTGKQRKGIGVRHNNFLFVDDSLIYGYTHGDDFSGNYAYHRVPFTNSGTALMYGYSLSKAVPKKEYAVLGVSSRSENTSLFVYQDIFREAEYLGEIYFGMDAKDKTVHQTTGTTTRDRLRVVSVGGNFIHNGFGGVTYLSPAFSQGINAFGARSKNPLSSRTSANIDNGIENTFSKFNLGIRHKRPLPLDLQLSLNFKSQISSEKLASQEEFYVGGIDSVRGYPSGDFLADDAFQTNLEILIPAFLIPRKIKLPYSANYLRDDVTALMFFDYAHGERKGVLDAVAEKRIVDFASVGAGLRIRLFNQALLRLEWGIPTGADRPITESSTSRLHFSVTFEDRLPEEIERIKKQIAEETLQNTARALINAELKRPESPLRRKLYGYFQAAQHAYDEGDLEETKKYYETVLDICASLQTQAINYVESCMEHQKSLKKSSELAKKYYNEGDMEKAGELWRKIKKDANIEPLVLEM